MGAMGAQGATGAPGIEGYQGAQGATGAFALGQVNFQTFVARGAALENTANYSTCEFDVCSSIASPADCGLGCSDNLRCRAAELDTSFEVNVVDPAHLGLTCQFSVNSRAAAVVEVGAGYKGQPDSCRLSHTLLGDAPAGTLTESKSSFCPVELNPHVDGEPLQTTLIPEVTMRVLSGIPACEDYQEITQEFNSDYFAASQGWTGEFYLNDRLQPMWPKFVKQNPSVVLDPSAPAAAEFRFWECSAFYYADETLGMALRTPAAVVEEVLDMNMTDMNMTDMNMTDVNATEADDVYPFEIAAGLGAWDLLDNSTYEELTFSFSFAIPEPSDDLFETLNRDDGSLFIGYFNKERSFESGVWYAQANLGVRLYFPRAQTSDNFWSSDDARGQPSETEGDLDGVPFLRLELEKEGFASEEAAVDEDNLVQLARGQSYRFEGFFDPDSCIYTGTVYELATTEHQYLLGTVVGELKLECWDEYAYNRTASECDDEQVYFGFYGEGDDAVSQCGAQVYTNEILFADAVGAGNLETFNIDDALIEVPFNAIPSPITCELDVADANYAGPCFDPAAFPAGLSISGISEDTLQDAIFSTEGGQSAEFSYDIDSIPGTSYARDAQHSVPDSTADGAVLTVLPGLGSPSPAHCVTTYFYADDLEVSYLAASVEEGARSMGIFYTCATDNLLFNLAAGVQLDGFTMPGQGHVIRVKTMNNRTLVYEETCPAQGDIAFWGLSLKDPNDAIASIELVEVVQCGNSSNTACKSEAGMHRAGDQSRLGQCVFGVQIGREEVPQQQLRVNAFGVYHEDWAEETSAQVEREDLWPLNPRNNPPKVSLWHDNFPENQDDFGGISCNEDFGTLSLVADNNFDGQPSGWELNSNRVRPGSDVTQTWDVSGGLADYGEAFDKRLESDPVTVPVDADDVVLEFYHFIDTDVWRPRQDGEDNVTVQGGARDFGVIEIQLEQTTGGWLHIPENSYVEGPPKLISQRLDWFDLRYINRPEVFGSDVENTPSGVGKWQRTRLSLAAFAGRTIRIRFRFRSDNVGSDNEGWYIEAPVVRRTCDVCTEEQRTVYFEADFKGGDPQGVVAFNNNGEPGGFVLQQFVSEDRTAFVDGPSENGWWWRTQVAGEDGYEPEQDISLLIPPFAIPSGDPAPQATISHLPGGNELGGWFIFNSFAYDQCEDRTIFEVSVNGADFEVIPQSLYKTSPPKHRAQADYDYDTPYEYQDGSGVPAFCDSVAQSNRDYWLNSVIDLSQWAGSVVQLRLTFIADDDDDNNEQPWYFDQIKVESGCPGAANLDGFEGVEKVEGGASACWNAKYRDSSRFRRGRGGIADDHLVGEAAVGDLVLDDVRYTIPPTRGYPQEGDVVVEASCSGEVYVTEEPIAPEDIPFVVAGP
jgi:hypothetical protein